MTTSREIQRHAGGRPDSFDEETATAICERMALGETLAEICRDEDMPSRSTVYAWRRRKPEFAAMYRRAREALVDYWADEIIVIADDSTLDTVTKLTPQGKEYEAVDHENIQRSKLRVDARKWLMSKLVPARYGERIEHEHSGEVRQVHELDQREKMRRLASFLAQDQEARTVIEGELVRSEEEVEAARPASDTDDEL